MLSCGLPSHYICWFRKLVGGSVLLRLAVIALTLGSVAQAAVFRELGFQSPLISFCFVSPAIEERPERVAEIRRLLKMYENVGAIRFEDRGTCPPAITGDDGNDVYNGGRFRIMLSGTVALDANFNADPVPGKGCTNRNVPSSWSAFPQEMDAQRSCLFNIKLGDDGDASGPYQNHPLHEFGHALGLAHEHERNDIPPNRCDIGGKIGKGFLTKYDPDSVMHYQFPKCEIDGNYGRRGLSVMDQLSIHMLYPVFPEGRAHFAEIAGTTVVVPDQLLELRNSWLDTGADLAAFTKDHVWTINKKVVSRSPFFRLAPPFRGTIRATYSFRDRFDRPYIVDFPVQVLEHSTFRETIAAPVGALSVLM